MSIRKLVWHMAVLLLLGAWESRGAQLQVLRGHVPSPASTIAPLGRVESTRRLDLSIGLPLRNQEALGTLLQGLYNPVSTNFHRFLTPQEFTARFGPSPADYQALIDFVRSNGLEVVEAFDDHTLLRVSAPVAAIEKAFHVTMREYQHPAEPRTFFAPDAEPSLDLAAPVLAINGLDNFLIPEPGGRPQTAAQSSSISPGGGSGPGGTYQGYDFRSAYVPGTALNGAGQAVGLLELDSYYLADISNYFAAAGLPRVALQNVAVDGFSFVPTANALSVGEVSLDIEVAAAMAPGLSKVIVYGATNNGTTFIDILHRMAIDNAAKQLSSSWFIFNNPSADQYYSQFAAQGQSFFQCSGDLGAFYSGIGQYADNTNITVVGGTSLFTTGPGGSYISESAWNNNDGTNGTGGGVSANFNIPSWQQSVSMASNNGSTTQRNVPDVSLVAQNVRVFYNNGSIGTFWGTSIAAPMWAGYTALINQQATAEGRPGIGFLNPALYGLAASQGYAALFHDVTAGNNTNRTVTTLYSAVAGYDLCTGLGTPTESLINALDHFAGAVWVDFSATGPGSGTYYDPYNTLALGISAVQPQGTVIIKGPGSTTEKPTLTKPMLLQAIGGTATIGN